MKETTKTTIKPGTLRALAEALALWFQPVGSARPVLHL
jgi:hypothetical protein